MSFLHSYQNRESWIHRMAAGVKLAGAILIVGCLAILPRDAWMAYAGAGAFLLLVAVCSRISWRKLVKKMLCVEPFAVGVALLALAQPNGGWIFLALLVKNTLCIFCMILLSSTTRFSDILAVLRRLRFPSLLITTLALMDRYLFVLAGEAGRLARARKSRTFVRGRASAWRSAATVIALLFVRASERAERVYDAMCARGWKT